MYIINKIYNQIHIKNFIITLSFIIIFYFWDFGKKYNLGIDTRYLTILPLLFFLKLKSLNNNLKLVYLIISYLLFQYIYNFIFYKKTFLLSDFKYFVAFTLTLILTVLCKNQILENKKKIIIFIILLSPFFILTSKIEIMSFSDRKWSCGFFNSQSILFNLFFLEKSHYGMIAIPALLLNIYYLVKKINFLNLCLTIIFFSSLLIFQSTTILYGLIINIIIVIIFNIKSLNFRFTISLASILLFLIFIFFNIYGCSRKITDYLLHSYLIGKFSQNFTQDACKIDNYVLKFFFCDYIKSTEIELSNNLTKEQQISKVNITTQVFKNSNEVAIKTFFQKPFGVGLNRFEDAFRDLIKSQTPDYLTEIMQINMNDGSSNFSKLIAEFGILSFVLFIYLFIFITSKNISVENKLFLFPIVLTQLLRGAGYFNGGFLVSVILIILIVNENYKKT